MSNFPSVRPSLNLQFDSQPTPADMTSHLASVGATFSRASVGTYTDANGLIQEASAGQARPNYSTAGVHEGLLIEGASTNEQGYSEDLNNHSGYDFTNVSVAESSITTPANDTNSYLMTETTGSAHYMNTDSNFRPSVSSGETWTISIFAKKGSGTNAPDIIQLTHSFGAFGSGQYANFNISTGVVTASSGGTARIEDVSNGWYRCSFTATSTSSGIDVLAVAFVNDNPTATRLPSYTPLSNSDVYLWGAQLEQQSQVTSYIPTDGATATRSADVCYIDGTAFTDFYNEEQGTVFVHAETFAVSKSYQAYLEFRESADNNIRLFTRFQDLQKPRIAVRDSATTSVDIFPSIEYSGLNKIVAKFSASDNKLYINGAEIGSDTSAVMPTLNRLTIGDMLDIADTQYSGTYKKIIYFPRALSDNELIKLTQ